MYNKNKICTHLVELIKKSVRWEKYNQSSLKYFHSDSVSLEICYKILKNYYKNRSINFEELFREMSYGSRQTIKKIIDDAIAEKILYVSNNKTDLRKRDIFINKIFVQEFENHMEELKNKLYGI